MMNTCLTSSLTRADSRVRVKIESVLVSSLRLNVQVGMSQNRGVYMGAPNLCFVVQKINVRAPLF